MNWTRRGARILGSFFTGYGGGFGTMIPAHYVLTPTTQLIELQWGWIFLLPLLSGLVTTWPQIGKMLNEFSKMEPDT